MFLPQFDTEADGLYGVPNLTGSPERNLWMSVLERAILDFVGNDTREAEAAAEWLFDDDGDDAKRTPYSFPWVCEQLDLNRKQITEVVRAMPKRGSRRVAPWYFSKVS